MSLPNVVRVNVNAPFPARVSGAGFISVVKANGVWTIGPSYPVLSALLVLSDPTVKELVIYDIATKQYNTITVAALVASVLNTYRLVTAAGDVTIAAGDVTILLQKTVGAATHINLPTSTSRNGVPVTVKDLKGDAHSNIITFVPSGTETIDGFSAAASAANGVAVIDINYGKKTLYPLTSGGWYL